MPNYEFSDGTKNSARKLAKPFTGRQSTEVHHIVAKEIANRYNLPPDKIRSLSNAIALEPNLHAWLHGKRFDELDHEAEWKGLEEDDYAFLAQSLLGIDGSFFE
jgi:hypothetical protein